MRFKKKDGKDINVNITKYQINWDKKCRSKIQFEVKQFLRTFWRNHYCLEEFRIPGSLMTIDLVNITKKIAIETSGLQHIQYNKFFHKGNRTNFRLQMERDVDKEDWCIKNNLILIEIFPKDIKDLSRNWFIEKYKIDII